MTINYSGLQTCSTSTRSQHFRNDAVMIIIIYEIDNSPDDCIQNRSQLPFKNWGIDNQPIWVFRTRMKGIVRSSLVLPGLAWDICSVIAQDNYIPNPRWGGGRGLNKCIDFLGQFMKFPRLLKLLPLKHPITWWCGGSKNVFIFSAVHDISLTLDF